MINNPAESSKGKDKVLATEYDELNMAYINIKELIQQNIDGLITSSELYEYAIKKEPSKFKGRVLVDAAQYELENKGRLDSFFKDTETIKTLKTEVKGLREALENLLRLDTRGLDFGYSIVGAYDKAINTALAKGKT